ncbi:pilus assembly protein PilM [Candidatus Uhrbacteria bacterium]|nr:pilus assembly protein PilM [Candidatus Uhrbacteria bacterium]
MGLFGKGKNNFIGVDIGMGGTKIVELCNEKGRARLVTYGFSENHPGNDPFPPMTDEKESAKLLKEICRQARTTTTKAVASLPISSVFSSVVTVQKSPEDKDFRETVTAQARKLIPLPLEDMVLDFKVIPQVAAVRPVAAKKEEETGQKPKISNQVLITGASRSLVQRYVGIFRAAGLEMVSLETETFPLIRSLIGKDRSITMIVDIGSVRTNIVIVENGIPYVARSLDMGGNSFTRAMSQSLSIELQEAERMKCDIKGVSSLYPGEELPKIFADTVMPMLTELQYSMGLYAEQGEGQSVKTVERVIVTGGASALPSLISHLEGKLSTKVYVGDPWARIVYPEGLRPVLDEIGYRYAVSVGLAMRDID